MRTFKANSVLLLFSLAAVSSWGLLVGVTPARGGEPIAVGGQPFGPITTAPGEPFLWDTSSSIPYRTDGGPMSATPTGTVVINNTAGNNRVEQMVAVWENVSTATIELNRLGAIKPVGVFTDGNVDTMAEFDAVDGSCEDERTAPTGQSPIIYDEDGTLFAELGFPDGVIGFAGPCFLGTDAVSGENRLFGGLAAMNGEFLDGIGPTPTNNELTGTEFDQAITHELGHFLGLGHSQINIEVLFQFPCDSDDVVGLPLMFPVLACDARASLGLDTLAPDDEAWISFLYPREPDFGNQFGRISGEILFSDGVTPVQGANVIARQVSDGDPANGDESRRNAVSVVSGYRFTGNPGQSVTATNPGSPFGSRDPTLIGFYEIPIRPGDYTVEVESIDAGFVDGSSVGPLGADVGEQFPLPGPPEFFSAPESSSDDPAASTMVTVNAGQVVPDRDIVLNGTPSRFDAFESARLWLREPAPAWVRRKIAVDSTVVG